MTPNLYKELRRLRGFHERASHPCEACGAKANLVDVESKKGDRKSIRCLDCRKILCYRCAHVHFGPIETDEKNKSYMLGIAEGRRREREV